MNVTFNLPIASVSGLISRSRDGRRLIAREVSRLIRLGDTRPRSVIWQEVSATLQSP